MLLLQQRMLMLQPLESLELTNGNLGCLRRRRCPTKPSLARLLPPSRKHDRMDVERLGHDLDFHPRNLAEPHSLALNSKV